MIGPSEEKRWVPLLYFLKKKPWKETSFFCYGFVYILIYLQLWNKCLNSLICPNEDKAQVMSQVINFVTTFGCAMLCVKLAMINKTKQKNPNRAIFSPILTKLLLSFTISYSCVSQVFSKHDMLTLNLSSICSVWAARHGHHFVTLMPRDLTLVRDVAPAISIGQKKTQSKKVFESGKAFRSSLSESVHTSKKSYFCQCVLFVY